MSHTQDAALQGRINTAKANAYAAFLAAMEAFDGHVYELKAMSRDHMGTHPDEMLWAAAAQVQQYNALLAQVTDSYHKRGEYAK